MTTVAVVLVIIALSLLVGYACGRGQNRSSK